MYIVAKGINEKARVIDKEDALTVAGWLAELNCVEKVSFQPLKETEDEKEGDKEDGTE